MNNIIKGKNVLLFCPDFFNYYIDIRQHLLKFGASVDIVLENFVNKSILYRFFWIKNNKTKFAYTNSYYNKIINKLNKDYDIIFVIRGEALTNNHLDKLHNKYPNAKFIMYQWDSVKNNPNSLKIEKCFDRVYTFDIEDSKKYGWKYRPLFYIDEYNKSSKKDIDFTFIGTLYYKRAKLSQLLKKYCNNNELGLYLHLYTPKIVYWVHTKILKDNRYSIADYNDIKHYSLNRKQMSDIYNRTKIICDYTADDQTGLTMRTIESIGYKCKLITNNKSIKETDLYKYGNIYIYDIDNFFIPKEFIDKNYTNLNDNEKIYYSIDGWINTIFSEIN